MCVCVCVCVCVPYENIMVCNDQIIFTVKPNRRFPSQLGL